jgi:hypothetical protein
MELYGECDTCNAQYELADRVTRCGECGNCGDCCIHNKCEICEENPKENPEGKWCASCRDDFKESR